MTPNPENRPESKSLEPVLDRIVKAGWARGYARKQDGGLIVKWTDLGEERMKALLECLNELDPGSLNQSDRELIWAVVVIYGTDKPETF
jgi:DNA-binding PadR family transcriptional regulator